jgi:hypothetical protein
VVRPATSSRAALREGGKRGSSGGAGKMLRTYFVPQWFNLSAPGVEEALWGAAAIRWCGSRDCAFVGRDDHLPMPPSNGEARPGRSFSLRELIQGALQKALSPVYGLLDPVP